MNWLAIIQLWISGLLQDLRYGLRMLGRNPLFSVIGISTLALGIAGNIVIFSFFNSFYLRPFPFKDPERLVDLDQTAPRWNLEYTSLCYPDFNAWRQNNRSFESVGAWASREFNLSFQDGSERVRAARVSHDLASVLGITPVVGRMMNVEDDRPGAAKVVLLGQSLWQRMFGGGEVLGKTLRLNQESYTVIGVLPRDTALLEETDLWVPLAENPDQPTGNYFLRGVGRLKTDVSLAMAREDLMRIHRGLVDQKRSDENTLPRLTSLGERYFGDQRLVVQVLLAAVALVLLIACGNLAALMLARGIARTREFGVRLSLGASPWRIAQCVGMEALLLSTFGGIAGAILGYWGLRTLLAAVANAARLPAWVRFDFDWRIGVFTVAIVLVAAFLAALPVIKSALKADLHGALQSSSRQSTVSSSRRRGLNALVVAEIAVTLVLMVQAGLLIQAFRTVQRADPGYRPDNVLLYEVALPDAKYSSNEARMSFVNQHLERVRALPGVLSASAVSAPPLGAHWGTFYQVENAPPKGPKEPDPVILKRIASPEYFETMGVKLEAGRSFTARDGLNEGSLAVVVNEIFARRFWPDQNPIGKRIRVRDDQAPWITVVGVVRDVKHYGLDRPMIPGVYLPYAQEPVRQLTLAVRTSSSPAELVSSIRTVVRQQDPELPIFGVTTMQERLARSMWVRRTYSCLIGIFAGVAFLMAVGGITGVLSYVVGRRTQEIGIRLALGAVPREVLWLVLRQGLVLASVGIGIGLAVALATTPLMRGLLFGVSPADPLTLLGIVVLLAAAAALACYLPARRAMKVEPVVALREE